MGKANRLRGQLEGKPKQVLGVGGRKLCDFWAGEVRGRWVCLESEGPVSVDAYGEAAADQLEADGIATSRGSALGRRVKGPNLWTW